MSSSWFWAGQKKENSLRGIRKLLVLWDVVDTYLRTPSLPAFPIGPNAPIFPIVILCRDQDESLKLRILAPFLYRVAQLKLDDRQHVAEAFDLLKASPTLKRSLFTKYGAYYSVFKGNGDQELVTVNWYVATVYSYSLHL